MKYNGLMTTTNGKKEYKKDYKIPSNKNPLKNPHQGLLILLLNPL